MELMDIIQNPLHKPPRNVSNSEVTCFLSCKRQYEYAFMMELQPIQTADPLARGSIFHDAMYRYWTERLAGKNHEQSMAIAGEAFTQPCEPTTVDIIMQSQYLWVRYMDFHHGFPDWQPLGTEVSHELPLTNSLTMAIKYDFYFLEIPTGKKFILDYKLSYDFWSPDDHDLNGQMPKYIAVLQANGFQVDGGILEEIRTRPLGEAKQADPKNLWRRTRYRPSGPLKQAVLRQHIAASMEIEKFRALSPEERKNVSLPVLNKHGACKFCNYKDLCRAQLEGKEDLTVDIRIGYRQSSYTQQYNQSESKVQF